ncbi:unnamed protein product [Larinioides sclopetarius]|uniref:Protein phosphatase n=1 Tax=Larinioides sclopetarius TaxID=280406 RepID=A0AAV1Z898_9ARAC
MHLIFPYSPDTADTSSVPVQEGDLILLATDGLFDNLPESVIVQQLSKLRPFALERCLSVAIQDRASFWRFFVGGKPDDITVLLAAVTNLFGEKSDSIAAVVAQHTCSSDHG